MINKKCHNCGFIFACDECSKEMAEVDKILDSHKTNKENSEVQE